jgi:alpha-N-arabinofuranosidase
VPSARLALHREFTVGPVPPRLFGSFVEHMGRCVYTGIFEPGHPSAGEDGLRGDVLDLVRDIGPTVVRYPGGNFVSGYRWEDGVGPVDLRPRRLDRAWHSVETNRFGLAEFAGWAERAGVEPMLALNLGTRGVQEACDLLEYANHPGGTQLSDLRRAHGRPQPYAVRLWCLGNELDGPWQVGHKTAAEYGRLAAETARAMRRVDRSVELVACGSSNSGMATFGEWERIVLEEAYDQVDHISAHAYYRQRDGDLPSYLASAVDTDRMIEAVVATADAVRARKRSRKRLTVSFDEWNVVKSSGSGPREWDQAPPIQGDEYTVTDAVVVGTLLHSLLRHGDRVAIGCQAQLVNVLGLIRTEPGGPAWTQPIALPFREIRRRAAGEVLRVAGRSDRHPTERHGDVDTVDAAATWDDDAGALALFVANRDPGTTSSLEVTLAGFPDHLRPAGVRALVAGEEQLRPLPGVTLDDGVLRADLPPLSWSVLPLGPAGVPTPGNGVGRRDPGHRS